MAPGGPSHWYSCILPGTNGVADRCSHPRGNVDPDLTPNPVHRHRGPKMRAKLANKSKELIPLLLLGQLIAERGDSQRVLEAQLPV